MRCEAISEMVCPSSTHDVVVQRRTPKIDYFHQHTEPLARVNYHDDQRSLIGKIVGDPMPEHQALRIERRKGVE